MQEKNNTVWEATLDIAKAQDGRKILYDIDPIKKVEGSGKSDPTTTENIVAEDAENVKSDADIKFSVSVTDPKTVDFLENQEHIVTYKAMQVVDLPHQTHLSYAAYHLDKRIFSFFR